MPAATHQPSDLIGASEAARVLGVSEKRVSQLVQAGRLTAVHDNPRRFERRDVMTLREERRKQPGTGAAAKGGGARRPAQIDEDRLAAVVATAVAQAVPKAIEPVTSTTAALQDALHEANARAAAADARCRDLEGQLRTARAELDRMQTRRLFGRRRRSEPDEAPATD